MARTSRSKEGDSSFVKAIEAATEKSVEADIDGLFGEIEIAADLLVKRRTLAELEEYRRLVASFMKMVTEKGLEVKEVQSARFLENNKVFLIAAQIEKKLLDLAEKVRTGNAAALDVAAATSEIRGLLMDMRI